MTILQSYSFFFHFSILLSDTSCIYHLKKAFSYASVNAATTFGNSIKWDALTKTASPSFTVARSSSVISSRVA